jgi:predicted Zn-dependent protease
MLAVAMPLAACGHAGLADDGGLGRCRPRARTGPANGDPAQRVAIPTWPGSSALAMNWLQRALGMMTRSQDTELEDYLNLIVNRLQATALHGVSGLFYRVYLIESPHANAFTPGGGHIFVTTGIIRRLRTEASWRWCWRTRWRTTGQSTWSRARTASRSTSG